MKYNINAKATTKTHKLYHKSILFESLWLSAQTLYLVAHTHAHVLVTLSIIFVVLLYINT